MLKIVYLHLKLPHTAHRTPFSSSHKHHLLAMSTAYRNTSSLLRNLTRLNTQPTHYTISRCHSSTPPLFSASVNNPSKSCQPDNRGDGVYRPSCIPSDARCHGDMFTYRKKWWFLPRWMTSPSAKRPRFPLRHLGIEPPVWLRNGGYARFVSDDVIHVEILTAKRDYLSSRLTAIDSYLAKLKEKELEENT